MTRKYDFGQLVEKKSNGVRLFVVKRWDGDIVVYGLGLTKGGAHLITVTENDITGVEKTK